MSTPAPAPNTVGTSINLDSNALLEKFQRALIIDDDPEYLRLYSENLSSIGIKSTCAPSLDAAAQELLTTSYPVVFCDNIFEDRPMRKGSEFIRDEVSLLGNAQVVLITGFALKQIEDLDTLKQRGIEIIEKKTGHIERMKTICVQTSHDRVTKFTNKLEGFCSSLVRGAEDESDIDTLIADPHLLRRARKYLVGYMKQLPDQDVEQIYIMGKAFSPRALIEEIGKGSQVARLLVDQVLDDLLEGSDE